MRAGRRGQFPCLCLAALLAFLAGGCGRKRPRISAAAAPLPVLGATEEGNASWYGYPYHGRPTTSGEIYDMEKLTAAHRTLPFGTRVLVKNLSNNRRVEVRINDRGPFVEDRIIDLSRAAARAIQMLGSGTARVQLRVVGLPEAPSGGFFAVQVGAFRSRENAERLRKLLAGEHGGAFLQGHEDPRGLLYRVLVGREKDISSAQGLAERLKKRDLAPFVVRIDESTAANQL
jgi:rare lipoprotein A